MKRVLLEDRDIKMIVEIIRGTDFKVKPDAMPVFMETYNRIVKAFADAQDVGSATK